jgi:hypothetical protein
MNTTGDIIKLVLTTFVRYAVVAVSAWLVKEGIMEQGEADALKDPTTLAILVAGLLAVATGVYLRLKSRFRTNTALKMPAGATKKELDAVVSDSSVAQILSTAAPPSHQIKAATNRV